jgi:hypothetical protein
MRAPSFRLLLWPLLVAVLAACTPAAAPPDGANASPGPTGIAGRVTDRQGAPAAGAFVYAYRSARGGLRGPADFEAPVAADGTYFLDLVEGRYHLVARLRQGGADAGPPRAGDAWALHPRNPVEVVAGRTSRADFVLHGITQPMLLKEGSLASGDTGFTGRIIDTAGRPVDGAFALAYRDGDFRRMPDHTSAAAAEDGRFTLYLVEPGRFCLAARTRTRGQPVAGEPYGLLGEGEKGCRQVRKGEILDVGEIVLRPYRR